MHLVLVRGFVMDFLRAGPPAEPKLSILVCSDGRLFQFTGATDETVRTAFSTWDASLLERSKLLLKTPLRSREVFAQDPQRGDPLYGWEVETVPIVSPAPRSCPRGVGTIYRLTYRTNPDVSIVDWQADLGVRGYSYQHHGTPTELDMRLASCSVITM